MPAVSGRSLRIRRGTTPIVGATTDSLTINAEPIDITDKDDAGWRTLLADVGVRSLEGSISGVTKDATLIGVIMGTASALLSSHTILISGIGTFAGNFFLSNVSPTGEQAGAVTFTATVVSSGVITWTPV